MRPHEKNARRPDRPGEWNLSAHNIPEPISLALGAALSRWGFFEQQLAALLSVVTGGRAVGRAVLKVVHAPTQRRKLLQAIVDGGLADEHRELLLPIISKFIALSKERNAYAHGLWGHHSAYPDEAILATDDAYADIAHLDIGASPEDLIRRVFKEVALVSERDLKRFSKEVSDLTGEMIGATFRIQSDDMRKKLSV